MQENHLNISFMFFFVIIALLIIMGANLIFGLVAGILTAIASLVHLFWNPKENIYRHQAWNPPWNPIANMKKGYQLSHKEWQELGKISPKKAIKAYNKATGVPWLKTIDKKIIVEVIFIFLILLCIILGVYFSFYPLNLGC